MHNNDLSVQPLPILSRSDTTEHSSNLVNPGADSKLSYWRESGPTEVPFCNPGQDNVLLPYETKRLHYPIFHSTFVTFGENQQKEIRGKKKLEAWESQYVNERESVRKGPK